VLPEITPIIISEGFICLPVLRRVSYNYDALCLAMHSAGTGSWFSTDSYLMWIIVAAAVLVIVVLVAVIVACCRRYLLLLTTAGVCCLCGGCNKSHRTNLLCSYLCFIGDLGSWFVCCFEFENRVTLMR